MTDMMTPVAAFTASPSPVLNSVRTMALGRILVGAFALSAACCMAPFADAGDAMVLAEGSGPRHPCQPQAAVSDDGAIHVVWGCGDEVFHRKADPEGTSFGPPTTLSLAPVMSLGLRRGPRVAASHDAVCITAIGGPTGKGRDGDVWAVRTIDGGRSWSDPVRLNTSAGSAREGLHGMAAGPDGAMCCVWLDLRNSRTEIMAATSTNGGSTWGRDVLVYRSPEKSVCECCHPTVAYDAQGRIYVQWRNSLRGSRDMFFARSDDGGTSFNQAKKLGAGSWSLNACPMDGGAIGVFQGDIVSTWRRERTVYLSGGADAPERAIGDGEQPWLATTANGPAVVWVTSRGGPLLLLGPGASTAVRLADHAADPALAVGVDSTSPLVAVWEERDAERVRVMCRVLPAE